jgi:hypothetical protein
VYKEERVQLDLSHWTSLMCIQETTSTSMWQVSIASEHSCIKSNVFIFTVYSFFTVTVGALMVFKVLQKLFNTLYNY